MPSAGNRYLVVGANSILSKAISERLLQAGARVTGVYHQRQDNIATGVERVPVEALPALPDEFEAVLLISAYIPEKNQAVDHARLFEVNVALAERVCRQFQRARVVYASSVSVYGEPTAVLTEQSASVHPGAYGLSKLWGEDIVRMHPAYAIVRIASMYGPGMTPTTFLPLVVAAALRDGRIGLLGQGTRRQNYIHVADVAELLVRAADPAAPNGTYLAAAEASASNLEVAHLLQAALPNVVVGLQGDDSSPSFLYDATFSYDTLGYRPRRSLADGLSELIQWQQNGS